MVTMTKRTLEMMVMIFFIPDQDMRREIMKGISTNLCDEIGKNSGYNKEGYQTDSDTVEYELSASAFEFSEVPGTRNDRESTSLGLDHDDQYDKNRENQEDDRENRHIWKE